MRIKALFPIAALLLTAGVCGGDEDCGSPGECDIAAAGALVGGDSAIANVWPAAGAAKPVVLYVDLSQSMRGFLDPAYPNGERIEYRNVIDILDARLSPSPINGFGSRVRVVGETARAALVDRNVYSDGNTQMEDVFPRVQSDSQLAFTHIVIGDGRRSSEGSAIDQFMAMRKIAAQWTARGGTFAVAASEAPFKPVAADPSGCRTARREDEDDEVDSGAGKDDARCPLYAFAFIAPGEQTRVVAVLAEVFEYVYVTPMPAVSEKLVHLQPASQVPSGIELNPIWVELGRANVARVSSDSLTTVPLQAEITISDAESPAGRAATAALRGQALRAQLLVRPDSLPAQPWQPAPFGGLVLTGSDPLHPHFISYGVDQPRWLYRIELMPVGKPSWLKDFDAENGKDARRTYGLGKLFQAFQQPPEHPALRAYVVVN